MRDDDMRDERAQRVDGRPFVFVDVDDDVCRLQRTHRIDAHGLRAAHFGHGAHPFTRMHAKAGAPDDLLVESEREQQFGDARHQRDDASAVACAGVLDSGCIDCLRAHRF
jgi:hypothetical protein